jgi:hypothetical protein
MVRGDIFVGNVRARLRVAEPPDELVATLEALDPDLGLALIVQGPLEAGADGADLADERDPVRGGADGDVVGEVVELPVEVGQGAGD